MSGSGLAARLVFLSALAIACEDGTAPSPPVSPPVTPAVPNGIWTVSGEPAAILRLSPAQLTGTGDRMPDTRITTSSAELIALAGVAFGPDGRLWIASAEDSVLLAFTPGALASPGSGAAPTVIATNGALRGPTGLAFDSARRLWVSSFGSGTLLRFDPDQLAAGGAPGPAVVVSGVGQPTALAFDAAGSLWVSDYTANRLVRYDAAQLSSSGSPTPAVVLTGINGSIENPSGLAFDDSGNLWVSNLVGGTVVAFGPAQLAASGSPAPSVVLSSNGNSLVLPAGLAFDADGSLWVLGGTGILTQFGKPSLGVTASPVPAARLQISGHTLFWGVAIRPGPGGLPLDTRARIQ
jgi:sugar lactone lactonase YvrE